MSRFGVTAYAAYNAKHRKRRSVLVYEMLLVLREINHLAAGTQAPPATWRKSDAAPMSCWMIEKRRLEGLDIHVSGTVERMTLQQSQQFINRVRRDQLDALAPTLRCPPNLVFDSPPCAGYTRNINGAPLS